MPKCPDDSFECVPLEVTSRRNESPERMVKRFMKKVRLDGVLREHSSRRAFEKPSSIKRRNRAIARWNAKHSTRK